MPQLCRLAPAAIALALVVACQGDRAVNPSPGAPSADVFDGREGSGGNADFFWLPPVAAHPTGEHFKDHAFNPDLRPYVEIRDLGTDAVILSRTPAVLVPGEELYKLEWSTPAEAGVTYRAFAFLSATAFPGETPLGYVDLAPRDNGVENLSDGTIYEFKEGRVVPLKMRIETHARCEDPASDDPCASETIIGADGGEVVLATGDRVNVPAQDEKGVQREFTLTLQLCNDDPIDVDLPTFGNCLRATVEPPLVEEPAAEAETFSPFINVLICSLDPLSDPKFDALSEAQEDLVTLFREDEEDGGVFALPKSVAPCPAEVGDLDLRNPLNLVRAGWRGLRDRVAALFGPQPLFASVAVLNTGGGGDSPFTSKFQLALPAQMEIVPGTTGSTVQPSGTLSAPSAPAVLVTNANDQPVAGARVSFMPTPGSGTITGPEGSETLPTGAIQVTTGSDGMAALASWTVGSTSGTHTVTASGRAIADQEDDGPFGPDISSENNFGRNPPQAPIPIPTSPGEVIFTAFAGQPDLVISSGAPMVTPNLVAPGGTVTLSAWTIKNQGSGGVPSGTNVNVAYLLSTDATITNTDVFLGSSFVTSTGMVPGQEITGPSLVFTIPAATEPGDYWIGILADQDNAVAESDEANNFVSTPLAVAITGVGTATVDGTLSEGEWDNAGCVSFAAALPEGGTTPATFCVMNNTTTFFAALYFSRSSDPQSLASVEFDLDGDAALSTDPGDDLILIQQPPEGGFFRDEHVFEGGTCPENSVCTTADALREGGTSDGSGAFQNDGARSVYEFSHPLASDDPFDISLSAGGTMRLQALVVIQTAAGGSSGTRLPPGRAGLMLLVQAIEP